MSQPVPTPTSTSTSAAASAPISLPVTWADPAREAAFQAWLEPVAARHGLRPDSLRLASADASFRRYLRLDALPGAAVGESAIVMDAPPDKENCEPFVRIARLMADAGLQVPQILEWDEPQGFMLLNDLGQHTMMAVIQAAAPAEYHTEPYEFWPRPAPSAAVEAMYRQAIDLLVQWQLASKPGVLPAYDQALLQRELSLFPDWYLGQHKGIDLAAPTQHKHQQTLQEAFARITANNLASPQVFVHRDFMPRNLMAPTLATSCAALPPEGAASPWGGPAASRMAPTLATSCAALPPEGVASPWGGPAASRMAPTLVPTLGVLDFQDAVYGPVTYDIASLMRDAFLTWDESFVLDVTVRYWEKARKAGLLNFEDWSDNFGDFYRSVEWMGLQRHLKVAGIFARLTLRDGKPKYLADAPRFIGYIRSTASRYRELTPLLRMIDEVENIQPLVGYAYGRMS